MLKAYLLSSIETMEKPPMSLGWITILRATRSRLPPQKKLKMSPFSSIFAQEGITTHEATYQIQDRASALMISTLPDKDKLRERHEGRHLNGLNMRLPVGLIHVTITNVYAKHLDFVRIPKNGN